MIGYIYKITNPSGNVYIGKTKNYKNRFNQYRNLHCESQPKLYNSFIKWGVENHSFQIIHKCDVNNLSEKEIEFIKIYDSFKNGMNCTIGGDDGFMYGDLNISKRPEVKAKMSKSKIEYYKYNKHHMQGKKHSEETIQKIKSKRSLQNEHIYYYVLDLQTGVYYNGIKELSKELNKNYKAFYRTLKTGSKYKNRYLIC